jgi:hypothetical protein
MASFNLDKILKSFGNLPEIVLTQNDVVGYLASEMGTGNKSANNVDPKLIELAKQAEMGQLPPTPREVPRSYEELIMRGAPPSEALRITNSELAPTEYLRQKKTELEQVTGSRSNRTKEAASSLMSQHPDLAFIADESDPRYQIWADRNNITVGELIQGVKSMQISEQEMGEEPLV